MTALYLFKMIHRLNNSFVRFFFQAEDGIRDLVRSRGLGDVYKRQERDNKVEIQLMSKGDQLMAGLRDHLGADKVPAEPLRSEWIGPKAGAQLRDAALKAILILSLIHI